MSIAGLFVIVWATQLIGYATTFPWLSAVVVLLGALGLGTITAAWCSRRFFERQGQRLAWMTLVLFVVAFAIWAYLYVFNDARYGTDEIAFNQYAAQLLVHGSNPYPHSMAPAFSLFHVTPDGYTYRLNGSPVTTLSYPALAFLIYVPMLALGWSTQLANVVNVAAWIVAIVLAFWLLPQRVRPVAIVIGSISVYVGYAVGGVTDALFVPLLVGAAYRWDRFGIRPASSYWWSPVLLGLAMSIKQTPWLILPFVVIGIVLEHHASGRRQQLRVGSRYVLLCLTAFLLPNIPFIIASPRAWLAGVTTPLLGQMVPAGQGLMAVSLFLGIGGGSLLAFSVASAVTLILLLVIFTVTYPRLKLLAFFLPSIALFVATRSLGSYLVMLLPAALVGAMTVRRGSFPIHRWRGSYVTVIVLSAVLAIVTYFAVATPAPLALQVTSVTTTGQLATVSALTVRATNRSPHAIRPAFSIEYGTTLTTFWTRIAGPSTLAPGGTALYRLAAPNFPSMPPITGGFQVIAFTADPASLSRSAPYNATSYHVSLVPNAINQPVPVGSRVTVTAEVLDHLNRPVHRAGIPVYMGQVIYAQSGLEYGAAIINGSQPGATPVTAFTNADGQAVFVIRGTEATADPVYFEANLVNGTQFYPFGYSDILSVRFSG